MLRERSIESVLLPYVEAGEFAGAAALTWRDGAIHDIAREAKTIREAVAFDRLPICQTLVCEIRPER